MGLLPALGWAELSVKYLYEILSVSHPQIVTNDLVTNILCCNTNQEGMSCDYALMFMSRVAPKHGLVFLSLLYKWKMNPQGVKVLPKATPRAEGGDRSAKRLALFLAPTSLCSPELSPCKSLSEERHFLLVDLPSSGLNPLGFTFAPST